MPFEAFGVNSKKADPQYPRETLSPRDPRAPACPAATGRLPLGPGVRLGEAPIHSPDRERHAMIPLYGSQNLFQLHIEP